MDRKSSATSSEELEILTKHWLSDLGQQVINIIPVLHFSFSAI